MRTYSGCRFSSFLSLGIALTCADAGRLIDLSSIFLTDLSFSSATGAGAHPDLASGGHRDWSPQPSRRVVGSRGCRRAGTGTERRFRAA
jgi:hypothetical protein